MRYVVLGDLLAPPAWNREELWFGSADPEAFLLEGEQRRGCAWRVGGCGGAGASCRQAVGCTAVYKARLANRRD